MKPARQGGGLVYSTEHGRMCPDCRQPVARCRCRSARAAPKTDGIVRIRLEIKGRNGKGVTVVSGIPLPPQELEALGRQLKQRCGCGGTVKDGNVEMQGDRRTLLLDVLRERGWTVKLAGG